ncbi:3-oxoacyl-[acyl-carrier-protein] synthase III [Panacagrimonas perspica]|uniref:Beta-ketoacyl-[acyl-carrier-protein] synthase III n=1 Tax=Panacagrimonas perspica TaxID=381431 RepID=A0A4S3JZL2_9GAMM|nr:beta-ketoacyl-ACP synthase III [Panacagrimonas perspica]TDU28408.1 3-oxoacyl-[acyl-carrier-protein] synthase III [Panacagrimonas perspica]THD01067.1 3-oxoacyl-ACP synthase [Panacagrimonas perspica]
MSYSRIVGVGSYLPARVVTNQDLESRIETSDEWIFQRTGIRSRRVAAQGEQTSDLALQASLKAMEMAGVTAADIDLIVVATTTPDIVFPSSACILQRKLGVKRGAAFDVQAVCTGFVYALAVADKFVASGQNKCALVVGAEVFSRLLDWNDRRTCVLFGDGAGAVVLKPSETPGILSTHLHAEGDQGDILTVPGTVHGGEQQGHPFVQMDGQAVFRFAVRALDQVCRETLEHNGIKGSDIDWLVPHQANIRIILATAQKLGMPPERVVTTLEHQGNTSAASVPLALDLAVRDGRIQPGHLVMLEAVGGGMTWGSALLRW